MLHKCSDLFVLKNTEYYDIAKSVIEDWNKNHDTLSDNIDTMLRDVRIQFQTDRYNEFTICVGFKFHDSVDRPTSYFVGCTKRMTYLNTVDKDGKRVKIKDKPNIDYGKKVALIRAIVSYLDQGSQSVVRLSC